MYKGFYVWFFLHNERLFACLSYFGNFWNIPIKIDIFKNIHFSNGPMKYHRKIWWNQCNTNGKTNLNILLENEWRDKPLKDLAETVDHWMGMDIYHH